MTGIEKLRAQVEGGTTANLVVPRALMRDILRQIEREAGAARAGGATPVGDVRTFPGLRPDKAQALKPLEEAAEVYAAWQEWDACGGESGGAPAGDLLGELADCVQACANLAASLGCDDMRPHMEAC